MPTPRRGLVALVLLAASLLPPLPARGPLPAVPASLSETPTSAGYWLVASDGGIFTFGGARYLGSTGDLRLNRPVVGMAATPSGAGYWLVASDGGIFTFGDAAFLGSTGDLRLNQPVVGMAATPTGNGYWLVASDGGIFTFGDAAFLGSTGSLRLNAPVVGMATTPGGSGYWMVASDGGVFTFGAADFLGTAGGTRPTVGLAAAPRGLGYWTARDDGGVAGFGDGGGGADGLPLAAPIVGMAAAPVRLPPEVSAFFYPWWATPARDGFWRHWEAGGRVPPQDVAANFYPARGVYSSSDPAVLDAQMAEMAGAGVDVVVSSWWGRRSFEDSVLPAVVRAASGRGLRVAVHLEPYPGRTPASTAADVAYLRTSLGVDSFYVYDAQRLPAPEWQPALAGLRGVRLLATGNASAARAAGLALFAREAGFDGVYTYDPTRSPVDLLAACAAARQRKLLCSPSVAPQYLATRQNPADRVVDAERGGRYDRLWSAALAAGADVVSITSYNEWHEGTQLEPAKPWCFPDGYCSPGYEGVYGRSGGAAGTAWLDRTRDWAAVYKGG